MKSRHSELKHATERLAPIVRWEFSRGTDRIICQIDRRPEDGEFALSVVPTRRLQWASVETYRAVAEALRRHATVASRLRASGWRLVAYTR